MFLLLTEHHFFITVLCHISHISHKNKEMPMGGLTISRQFGAGGLRLIFQMFGSSKTWNPV